MQQSFLNSSQSKTSIITWDKSGRENYLETLKNLTNYLRKSERPSVGRDKSNREIVSNISLVTAVQSIYQTLLSISFQTSTMIAFIRVILLLPRCHALQIRMRDNARDKLRDKLRGMVKLCSTFFLSLCKTKLFR